MTTKDERNAFSNKMKSLLVLNNYGFQLSETETSDGFHLYTAKNMKAIRELLIRLSIWTETGNIDSGIIPFPEAKRRIIYHFDDQKISKCQLKLLVE